MKYQNKLKFIIILFLSGLQAGNYLFGEVFFFVIHTYSPSANKGIFTQKDTSLKSQKENIGEVKYNLVKVNLQWASKIINFSSQYSEKEKSAKQILGKPNVLPTGGSSLCAWTVKKKTKQAFIRVAFEKPLIAQQVVVAENYNPGAVEKIILYGAHGEEQIVYQNSPAPVNTNARMLNIFFEQTLFEVVEGELFLNPRKVSGFEIDAFGISDSRDTIKACINVVSDVKYSLQKESLGASINTTFNEIAPVISPDGKALYFDRKFSPENTGGKKDEDDIWFSRLDDKGNWSYAVNMGSPLNTQKENFVQSISPDGNILLLGNVYEKKGYMSPGVSISNKTKEDWSFPATQNIQDFENFNRYANYYLSNDGKFLLMSIETSESYGGLDIYVSFKISENNWSKPKNLETIMNTAANDYSPFLAADGVTLYYSTSGISGYGKEDIFMTRRLDDTWQNWTEPMNLGPDINTKESDSKYTIPASGEFAYFSSMINFAGYDIFRIKLPDAVKPQPVVLVKGKVLNKNNNKPVSAEIIFNNSISNKEIGIVKTYPKTGDFVMILPAEAKYSLTVAAGNFSKLTMDLNLLDIKDYKVFELSDIKLIHQKKNIKGTISDVLTEKKIKGASVFLIVDPVTGDTLVSTTTDELGEFNLDIPENQADDNKELLLVVKKEGYEKKEIKIFESGDTDALLMNFDMKAIMKKEKVLEFHNIYFEYKSADLNDRSRVILDRLADIMKENKSMEIELSAHTDSRANAEYNMILSQKRADNAKIYMVSKGISTTRIMTKGYGETMLLNRCKDGIECSEEEHTVNRRIEVKVLKLQ